MCTIYCYAVQISFATETKLSALFVEVIHRDPCVSSVKGRGIEESQRAIFIYKVKIQSTPIIWNKKSRSIAQRRWQQYLSSTNIFPIYGKLNLTKFNCVATVEFSQRKNKIWDTLMRSSIGMNVETNQRYLFTTLLVKYNSGATIKFCDHKKSLV